MGLVRLLTVGRTLRLVKDEPHRFRTPAGRAVPRFEASLRARRRAVIMKTAVIANPKEAGAEVRPGWEEPARTATPGLGATDTVQSRVDQAPRKWSFWGLFGLPRMGRKTVRPARKQVLKAPVQQELSLDNLKVCRNDLSDSDWELVEPPKSGARLAFLRQLARTGDPAPRGSRWAPQGARVERARL